MSHGTLLSVLPPARRLAGLLAPLALVLGLAQCGLDDRAGLGTPSIATVSVRGQLPPNFSLFAGNLIIEQARLALVRGQDTIFARTVSLPVDSASVRLTASVVLNGQSEMLLAVLEYKTATGQTLFRGQVQVNVQAGSTNQTPPTVPLTYSGPGSNIAFLSLTPTDDTIATGDSVVYQVSAIDSNQAAVPQFYVSWSTDHSQVEVNGAGVLRAPANVTASVVVTAATPTGISATANVLLLGGGLGIVPDSVELLPGGKQTFTVAVGGGRGSTYNWTVNGIANGNATFGTVDSATGADAYYSAPATVPNPDNFDICATDTQNSQLSGCAEIVISPIPSSGTDVIVINDMNLFDPNFMAQDANNALFAANLVNYTAPGPRSNGTVVMYDRGRNSSCFNNGECGDQGNATIDSVLAANGFSIVKVDSVASWASIPGNVKVIFLWNPTIPYDTTDINGFKAFAAQGGRIVFLGEHVGFYGTAGIDTENRFLSEMGSQFTNIGAVISCIETIPAQQISQHQTTAGLTTITIACASEARPGPNDFSLVRESQGLSVAGVAKISTVPLPIPPGPQALPATPARRLVPPVDGANRRGPVE